MSIITECRKPKSSWCPGLGNWLVWEEPSIFGVRGTKCRGHKVFFYMHCGIFCSVKRNKGNRIENGVGRPEGGALTPYHLLQPFAGPKRGKKTFYYRSRRKIFSWLSNNLANEILHDSYIIASMWQLKATLPTPNLLQWTFCLQQPL